MLIREGQNSREAALRKYFAKLPEEPSTAGAIILLILGGVALVAGFQQISNEGNFGMVFLIIGLALAGVGGIQFSNQRKDHQTKLSELQPQPSDQQVQGWFYEGIHGIIMHSRCALGLDQLEGISEPLVVRTPTLWSVEGVDKMDLLWKKGEDQVLRFGVYRLTIIWLTDRHFAAHSCYYDFLRDIPVNERTDEFHFCDVVSFVTQERSNTEGSFSAKLETTQKATIQQEFIVSVGSGEAFRVTLDDGYVQQITGEEKLPETGAEKAVATIRAMLRNTKRKEAEAGLSSAA